MCRNVPLALFRTFARPVARRCIWLHQSQVRDVIETNFFDRAFPGIFGHGDSHRFSPTPTVSTRPQARICQRAPAPPIPPRFYGPGGWMFWFRMRAVRSYGQRLFRLGYFRRAVGGCSLPQRLQKRAAQPPQAHWCSRHCLGPSTCMNCVIARLKKTRPRWIGT